MANSHGIRPAEDGFEGISPTEVKAEYITIRQEEYDALMILVIATLQADKAHAMPEELRLAVRRVEKVFTK